MRAYTFSDMWDTFVICLSLFTAAVLCMCASECDVCKHVCMVRNLNKNACKY